MGGSALDESRERVRSRLGRGVRGGARVRAGLIVYGDCHTLTLARAPNPLPNLNLHLDLSLDSRSVRSPGRTAAAGGLLRTRKSPAMKPIGSPRTRLNTSASRSAGDTARTVT